MTLHSSKRRILNKLVASICGGAALLVGVWGLYPFGGDNLPALIASSFKLSFKSAALIVSMLVAVMVTVSLTLFMWKGGDAC